MMVNDSGPNDLYQFLLNVSHGKDVENAQQGVGMYGMIGTVTQGPPDVQIFMQGVNNLAGEDVTLSSTLFDLIIPDGVRLTPGDVVGLVPFRVEKLRWWVLGVIRDPTLEPLENARFGYNGDRNTSDPTGKHAGILVTVADGDHGSTSVVTVEGASINVTSYGGAQVTIDGLNFKGHVHTQSGGGNTGGAHA